MLVTILQLKIYGQDSLMREVRGLGIGEMVLRQAQLSEVAKEVVL